MTPGISGVAREDLHDGYPATVDGQVAFFRDLRRIVTEVPNGRGVGLYYWEPAWITAGEHGSPLGKCGVVRF